MPKPPAGSKRAERAGDAPQLSRAEDMKRQKIVPQMPPNPMPHIVERLVEIGLQEPAGMGVGPISWGAINDWQRAVGVMLAPWEARLLRRLSTAYVAEGRKAEAENCPPPWRTEVTTAERDAEDRELRALLG